MRREIHAIGRPRGDIDLRDLRAFVAVYFLGTNTAAAEALDVPQSSVSRRMAKLERIIGQPLFVRHIRAMTRTAKANRIIGRVVQALRLIDGIR